VETEWLNYHFVDKKTLTLCIDNISINPFSLEYDSSQSDPFYPEYNSSSSLHLAQLPRTLTYCNPIGLLTAL